MTGEYLRHGWVKPGKHVCEKAWKDASWGESPGTIWQCNECGKRWIVQPQRGGFDQWVRRWWPWLRKPMSADSMT